MEDWSLTSLPVLVEQKTKQLSKSSSLHALPQLLTPGSLGKGKRTVSSTPQTLKALLTATAHSFQKADWPLWKGNKMSQALIHSSN